MDSKTRPLFLVFKNVDDLGDLVRIIFKNGDGECGISFDRLIVMLSKRFSRNTPCVTTEVTPNGNT